MTRQEFIQKLERYRRRIVQMGRWMMIAFLGLVAAGVAIQAYLPQTGALGPAVAWTGIAVGVIGIAIVAPWYRRKLSADLGLRCPNCRRDLVPVRQTVLQHGICPRCRHAIIPELHQAPD